MASTAIPTPTDAAASRRHRSRRRDAGHLRRHGQVLRLPHPHHHRRNSLAVAGGHPAEAKDEGADALVTPCPLCHRNLDAQQFDAARVVHRRLDLSILRLPQLLGLTMGLEPEKLGLGGHVVSVTPLLRKVAISGRVGSRRACPALDQRGRGGRRAAGPTMLASAGRSSAEIRRRAREWRAGELRRSHHPRRSMLTGTTAGRQGFQERM